MELAKDCLDIGMLTDTPDLVDFVSVDVGLGEPEALPIASGVTQYRFDTRGSVIKVNVVDRLDTDSRSGLREVRIAVGEPGATGCSKARTK